LAIARRGRSWQRSSKTTPEDELTTLLNEAMSAVRKMKWHNFELLMAEGFRLQGFSVTGFAAPGSAEGSDMTLEKGQKKFCVQCRDWQVEKVGVVPIEKLAKAMAERNADGGYVITTGEISEEAAALAAARKIQFVRGPSLLAMMEKAKETITTGVPAHFSWNAARSSSGTG
jgi:restriction system protein